jgi:hypothetical protein
MPERSTSAEETLEYSSHDKDDISYGMVAESPTPYGDK